MFLKREPRQERSGSRCRERTGILASVVAGAVLTACVNHYQPTTLPLPVSEGWVQLPTARWLTNAGIEPGAMMFCPRETCGQQVLVARMELTGEERGVADLIARDPASFVARTRPTYPANTSRTKLPRASRMEVRSLEIGDWRGGVVTLRSAKDTSRAAHVAVLASSHGAQARLVLTVAETGEAAEQYARRILE